MYLYSRVNILEGKAVRLPRGDIADAIFLDADPVARAHGWVEKGADRLLVIDLDAAAYGDHRNRDMIAELVRSVGVEVTVGGGVRTPADVDRTLNAGAARVVMGTVAVIDQVLFWDLCRDHPDRIVVSLDVRDDEELFIRGWTEKSGQYLEETLIELSSAGAAGYMVTEVGRDALAEPPNFEALKRALSIVDEPVVASGGVRNFDDLRALKELEVDGKHLVGVVVGREVTAGRFTLEDAAALLRREGSMTGPWEIDDLRTMLLDFRKTAGDEGTASEFLDWLGLGVG